MRKASDFINKETPTQVFFCDFCSSFKNTFFTERAQATASVVEVAVVNPLTFGAQENVIHT